MRSDSTSPGRKCCVRPLWRQPSEHVLQQSLESLQAQEQDLVSAMAVPQFQVR